MRLIDLSGVKIGSFTVIERSSTGINPRWKCECECGEIKHILGAHLRAGRTRCKCQNLYQTQVAMLKIIWRGMIDRCENPRNNNYKNYGGRGIKVCPDWHDFEIFLKDMGLRPDNKSIDRINNNGDYEPNNCRWATQAEQMANVRRNVVLTYDGKTMIAAEWARYLGITREAFRLRLAKNLDIDKTFQKGRLS